MMMLDQSSCSHGTLILVRAEAQAFTLCITSVSFMPGCQHETTGRQIESNINLIIEKINKKFEKKLTNYIQWQAQHYVQGHSSSKQHKLVYQLQCQILKKVLVPFGWCDLSTDVSPMKAAEMADMWQQMSKSKRWKQVGYQSKCSSESNWNLREECKL